MAVSTTALKAKAAPKPKQWLWEAKNRSGEVKKGEMEALDAGAVDTRLKALGLSPVKVKKKPAEFRMPTIGSGVSGKDILVFTKQFATMIDAGLPLVQCLDILANQMDNAAFKRVLLAIKAKVESGSTFADALLRARGQLQARLDAEARIQLEAEAQALHHLLLHLLLGAEDVGVVLGDVAHAQQPVEHAARLVAVHQPRLAVADRQIAVGAALVRVDLDVRRAVHRLEAHRTALDVSEVHVVLVLVPVTGLLPQLDVVEDRRFHLAVATARVLRTPQLCQRVVDRHPRRLPEGAAR